MFFDDEGDLNPRHPTVLTLCTICVFYIYGRHANGRVKTPGVVRPSSPLLTVACWCRTSGRTREEIDSCAT